jgi:hypothetical protein
MGFKAGSGMGAIALGVAALLALPAAAAASDGDAKAKARKDDPNRMVCRSIMPSGSRISQRTCRSKADWDRDERETQDAALNQQNGPGYRPPPDNLPLIGQGRMGSPQ